MGAESYDVNPGYLLLLGGVATALSVVFEGCLLIAKLVDVPKAWWFSLLSLIPYFFYIPLNTQVSDDQQVWIRFPALYETAALLLIVAAAFLSVAACALACICASGERHHHHHHHHHHHDHPCFLGAEYASTVFVGVIGAFLTFLGAKQAVFS